MPMKISGIFFGTGVVLGIVGFVFFVRVNFIFKSDSPVGLYVSGAAFLLIVVGVVMGIFQNRKKHK